LGDANRLIELQPKTAILYALRGAAKAIGGDKAGATADINRALSMTNDPAEINAIKELRTSLGL